MCLPLTRSLYALMLLQILVVRILMHVIMTQQPIVMMVVVTTVQPLRPISLILLTVYLLIMVVRHVELATL